MTWLQGHSDASGGAWRPIIDLCSSLEMKTALEAQTVHHMLSQNASLHKLQPSLLLGGCQLGTKPELLNFVSKPCPQVCEAVCG
jgi:hypothetical protein